MADIAVRNNGDQQAKASRLMEPIRRIRNLFRHHDPFQEMAPVWPELGATYLAPFDVKETKDSLLFRAEVPGIKEQDLEVTLTGDRLTVAGRRSEEKEESGDTYYACERSYGSFSRAFTLPDGLDADHVQAELRNGVLSIAIAKKPASPPRKIAVTSEKAKA